MTYRLLILAFYLLSSGIFGFSQNSYDDRLRYLVNETGQAEVIITLHDNNLEFLTRNFSIASVKQNEVRIFLSERTVELFIKQKFPYTIIEPVEIRELRSATDLASAMEWDVYPTYDQYLEIMKGFTIQYPSLCILDTIGTTVYGKLVLALKISDNATSDEDEPEVFYTSTMHGNETGGFILMLRLTDYLLENYQNNQRIRDLIDDLEIWINPLANPDGAYRTGNTINATGTNRAIRFNANFYDLNRNFPDPETPYNGDNVMQKETADMIKFLSGHRFVLSANFHSGEEVVNYPWDSKEEYHADNVWFTNISRAYADTVHRYSIPTYMDSFDEGVVRGIEWYKVYGGRQDYVTRELQGRELTIEIDNNYIAPVSYLNTLWDYNFRSLIGYLENARYGVHGRVTDVSAKPVPTIVFIKGYDRDSSQIYSDTLSGRYIRMLAPGSKDITFTAIGYKDTTIRGVLVAPFTRTNLDVMMLPLPDSEWMPFLFPNPASTYIKAWLPMELSGPIRVEVYSSSGRLMQNYQSAMPANRQVVLNIDGLSPGVYIVKFASAGGSVTGRIIVMR